MSDANHFIGWLRYPVRGHRWQAVTHAESERECFRLLLVHTRTIRGHIDLIVLLEGEDPNPVR